MPFQLSDVVTHAPSISWRDPSPGKWLRDPRAYLETRGISVFPLGSRPRSCPWTASLASEQVRQLRKTWQVETPQQVWWPRQSALWNPPGMFPASAPKTVNMASQLLTCTGTQVPTARALLPSPLERGLGPLPLNISPHC